MPPDQDHRPTPRLPQHRTPLTAKRNRCRSARRQQNARPLPRAFVRFVRSTPPVPAGGALRTHAFPRVRPALRGGRRRPASCRYARWRRSTGLRAGRQSERAGGAPRSAPAGWGWVAIGSDPAPAPGNTAKNKKEAAPAPLSLAPFPLDEPLLGLPPSLTLSGNQNGGEYAPVRFGQGEGGESRSRFFALCGVYAGREKMPGAAAGRLRAVARDSRPAVAAIATPDGVPSVMSIAATGREGPRPPAAAGFRPPRSPSALRPATRVMAIVRKKPGSLDSHAAKPLLGSNQTACMCVCVRRGTPCPVDVRSPPPPPRFPPSGQLEPAKSAATGSAPTAGFPNVVPAEHRPDPTTPPRAPIATGTTQSDQRRPDALGHLGRPKTPQEPADGRQTPRHRRQEPPEPPREPAQTPIMSENRLASSASATDAEIMKTALKRPLTPDEKERVQRILPILIALTGCAGLPIDQAAHAATQPATTAAIAAAAPQPYGTIAALVIAAAGGLVLYSRGPRTQKGT